MRLHHSLRVKETLLAKQNGKCSLCGQELCGRIDWDHIIPLALGGPDTPENLQAVHADGCHSEKTKQDIKRIRKADRQGLRAGPRARLRRRKAQGLGSKLQSRRKIVSAGFDKTRTKRFDGTVIRKDEG